MQHNFTSTPWLFPGLTNDYCIALLAGLPSCATKHLQMIQNAATRLVFNEPKRVHVTPLFISLCTGCHSLLASSSRRALTLAYRSTTSSALSYFHSLLRSINGRWLVVPSQNRFPEHSHSRYHAGMICPSSSKDN